MSDHLHDWLSHTQPNVHGGEDLFAHGGGRIGSTMPSVDGGHDVLDAHGGRVFHVSHNVHGGHDVTDHSGHIVSHGFRAADGGEDVYGADAHRLGHIGHDHGTITAHDTEGHFQTWRANVFGGMTADPLSNMRALQFPAFRF